MSKKQQKKIVNKLKYAVLICQTFLNDFSSSSCFMYVDNYPLITYSLNWISESGIQQIFVFYSKQKEQVEGYFSKYQKSIDLKVNMEYVKVGELKNFGDVMRQTQFRNLISQDFLVLYADTLTNIDLSKMIQSHFSKKQQLKNVVLTTGMQEGIAKNIHVLNSNTNQILQVQLNTSQDFTLNSDKINLKKISIDIRRDICPIDIFICTVDVLKSFKQTFQFANMNDFIIGMITSEVYEQKINAYIIEKQQRSFRANRGVNLYLLYMNYICRYLYPYCIQNQQELQPKQKQLKYVVSHFSIQQFNKIIKTKSQVKQSARISHNVFIGQNSKISQNAILKKSIVLKNCNIGNGASLQNCIVLDGCQIPNNATYTHSLIQNVGSTLKIVSFKNQFNYEPYQILIDSPLYQQTPEEVGQNNFQDDLLEIIKEEPQGQALTDLFTLRKIYNKPLDQFTKQMIRLSAPSGVKGVQKFVQSWGQILVKFHQDQQLLLSSLFYACKNIESYQKAFHIFLQFLYRDEVLSSQKIKKWFQGKDMTDKTLLMASKFVAGLDQESQQDQQNDEQ